MTKLRFIRGTELYKFSRLQDTMFKDRAAQFVDRLRWKALEVDDRGWERDEYDQCDPLYVIWELSDGTHGASMRLLPMNGPNMIHDHFSGIIPRHQFRSPDVWECSRFVLSKRADKAATSSLFVGAGGLLHRGYANSFLGLFDKRMLRVYKNMRNSPELLGFSGSGDAWVAAGRWEMSIQVWRRSLSNIGIRPETLNEWFASSYPYMPSMSTQQEEQAAFRLGRLAIFASSSQHAAGSGADFPPDSIDQTSRADLTARANSIKRGRAMAE